MSRFRVLNADKNDHTSNYWQGFRVNMWYPTRSNSNGAHHMGLHWIAPNTHMTLVTCNSVPYIYVMLPRATDSCPTSYQNHCIGILLSKYFSLFYFSVTPLKKIFKLTFVVVLSSITYVGGIHVENYHNAESRPLFTKKTEVLPQDLVKFQNREIACYNDRMALKFDRHLGSAAAWVPVKFQSNWKSLIKSNNNQLEQEHKFIS